MASKTATEVVVEIIMIQIIIITMLKKIKKPMSRYFVVEVGLCPILLTIFLSVDFTEYTCAVKPRQTEFMRSMSSTDRIT